LFLKHHEEDDGFKNPENELYELVGYFYHLKQSKKVRVGATPNWSGHKHPHPPLS
jgi:hypothetical protein